MDGGSDLDLVTYAPIPGVSVAECQLLDPGCQSATARVATDDAGLAHFATTGNFAAYFRFSDTEDAGLLPTAFYPGALQQGVPDVTFPTFVLSYAAAGAFGATGIPSFLDASPGQPGNANFEVFDCLDHHAAGVVFSTSDLGESSVLYYIKDGVPSLTANQTDSYGTAGLNGVPSGSFTIHATLAGTSQSIGTATGVIRPGEATVIWLRARIRSTAN